MTRVDRARVRASFSRSAASYDAHAEVQRQVRARIVALAAEIAPRARRALDVGAGTGALLARLAAERPHLATAGIDLAPGMCATARAAAPGALLAVADAEALPFAAGTFELALSTSTFQWLTRLGPAMAEVHRVLAPRGAFCLALFGERTLHELKAAFRAASVGPDRTHQFFSREEVVAALSGAGFRDVEATEEELVEWHADARAVLRSLKGVGATNAVPGRRGLGGRAEILRMLRRYDTLHAGARGVPATYHVVYAMARRG